MLNEYTGQGLGPRAIEESSRRAFCSWPELERILAYVRSDNHPSLKAFDKVGFQLSEHLARPAGYRVLARNRDHTLSGQLH